MARCQELIWKLGHTTTIIPQLKTGVCLQHKRTPQEIIEWSLRQLFLMHIWYFFFFLLSSPLFSSLPISHFCPSVSISIIAARRKSLSRRRRSQTLPLHLTSRRFTPITTLWRLQPPPPPSRMALPFFPPLQWPGNWHDRRPSAHPVHTMRCLSTSSHLSRSSTTNQMGWGTEGTGSAIAVSSSRIWTCQCL